MFRISKLSKNGYPLVPKKRLLQLLLKIITVRNSSCRKVMFSQVSICPQGGGVLSRPPPREDPPPKGDTCPPGRQAPPSWQADNTLWETDTPLAGRHPPADGYCSGRYASYLNAFLLKKLQYCAPNIELVLKRLHKSVNLLQNFPIYLRYLPPYFLLKKKLNISFSILMKFTHKAIIENVAFQFGVEYVLMQARQPLISTHDRLLRASTVKHS